MNECQMSGPRKDMQQPDTETLAHLLDRSETLCEAVTCNFASIVPQSHSAFPTRGAVA